MPSRPEQPRIPSLSPRVFWPVIAGLAALYALIRYAVPAYVTRLYAADHLSLIKKLTHPGFPQPLEFYLGKIEDVYTGPAYMLCAGVILLLLTWRWRRSLTAPRLGLMVLGYYLLTKFEILFYPVYGDSMVTAFAEAIWLKRHHFDYATLATLPNFQGGGPNVYLLSIYPTIMAAMMLVMPPKIFLIVNHAIAFGLGAATAALFRDLLRRVFDDKTALLAALLLVSLPLYQSMVEQISMALPVTFFSVLAMHALCRRRFAMASITAIIAALIKGYALSTCLTVLIIALLVFCFDRRDRFRFGILFWGMFGIAFLAAKSFLPAVLFHISADVDRIAWFGGVRSLKGSPVTYYFLASLAILAVLLVRRRKRPGDQRGLLTWLVEDHYIPLVCLVMTSTWFFTFLNAFAVAPRYRLLLTPFILFTVLYVFHLICTSERIVHRMLTSLILFASLCSFGLVYPHLVGKHHVILERCLTYRNDLKANRAAAKLLNDSFYNMTIGAPFILAQALALPELGYVDRDLDVIIYGMLCKYGGIKEFAGIENINHGKTVWVGENIGSSEFPVTRNDQIITRITFGDRENILFHGGYAIQDRFIASIGWLPQAKAAIGGLPDICYIGRQTHVDEFPGEIRIVPKPMPFTSVVQRIYKVGDPQGSLIAVVQRFDRAGGRIVPSGKPLLSQPVYAKDISRDTRGGLYEFRFVPMVTLEPGMYAMSVQRQDEPSDEHYFRVYTKSQQRYKVD